jgi:hypothetical protein
MKFLEIINKIKRRAGEIAFLLFGLWVIMNPTAFITLGGDAGYKLFTCVWALIIAHLAISQIDRHWSQADDNKDVSLSNFMKFEASADQKAKIYAVIIGAIALIISAIVIS